MRADVCHVATMLRGTCHSCWSSLARLWVQPFRVADASIIEAAVRYLCMWDGQLSAHGGSVRLEVVGVNNLNGATSASATTLMKSKRSHCRWSVNSHRHILQPSVCAVHIVKACQRGNDTCVAVATAVCCERLQCTLGHAHNAGHVA